MAEQGALETLLADAQDAQDRGAYESLRTIALEAASVATAAGDDLALGLARNFLGVAEMRSGLASRAEAAFDEALAIFVRLGARAEAARVKMNQGALAFDARLDITSARRIYEEVIPELEQLGREPSLAVALANASEICRAIGDYSQALGRSARAIELFERNGHPWRAALARVTNAHVHSLVRRYDESIARLEEAYSAICESGNPASLALYFEVYALVAAACEQFAPAAELFGFVDALRHREDIRPNLSLMPWIATAQQRVRTALTMDGYDVAYYIGAHASLDAMRDRVERLATSLRISR